MASILRSSKFVRYIAGFTRNVVLNTPREFDGNVLNVNHPQCLCGGLPRSLTSQPATSYDQNLEHRLRSLDQDVRKSGRISRRDIEDVLEEIRNARSATSSQALLVIRCCGNLVPEELPEVRTKLVQEIWNTLRKLNVPMDVSHYNALLRVYLENEHPFSPTDFLSDMESKGIEPNRVTYQRLIARYCQIGDIEGATRILEFMREKQLPVNENVFNALIVGHSEAGDMDSARDIINVMSQADLEPSADTYTTLLCGYAKKGDLETMQKILEDCEVKEIYLLDKDYLDIVYALAINGHGDKAPAILSKVRKAIGYSQDAINLILRLINKGHDQVGFEVLKTIPRSTKPDGTTQPIGNFFIRQLVKTEAPIEKIIKYCNLLEAENMYKRGLLLATETALSLGNDKMAYKLLEELQKTGQEIRQHFFWPLILAKANEDPSGKAVVDVLTVMKSFNVLPSSETLREYVIPHLKGNSSEILAKLREANVSVGASAASLVVSLLQKDEIREAAVIASTVRAFYNPELIKRSLSVSFYKTKDLESYITVVRSVIDNLERRSSITANEETYNSTDKAEVLGQLILDLSYNPREFVENVEAILEELVKQGLSISASVAEKIQDKLKEKMTDNIANLLGKLASGELIPVPLDKKPPSYTPSHQMNIPQLERLIQNLSSKNQDTKGLKRQLLTLYYRVKDLPKTEALIEELKKEDFVLTSGVNAQLLDLYAYHDQVDKALECYQEIKKTEGESFKLDDQKVVRLSYALSKAGRFNEAIEILEKTPSDDKRDRSYSYNALLWRYLNSLAEQGKVDELEKLFDTLTRKQFLEINNVILGPLVKVHLANNDLEKALEKFEWCVNHHKATPWKNELACRLIQAENAEKLQKLTDLSTIVHGEINSLYDLVFAFVECGRMRQARKILETPGLQNRPQRISSACERYQQEGLIKPLESLKDATKDLNHIDRTDIYYQLLLSYIKQDDIEKSLGLWTQMQEEDLLPNDQFLMTLGKFLKEKNVEVPFAMPSPIIPQPATSSNETFQTPQTLLKQRLQAGDIEGGMEIYKSKIAKFSNVDCSTLIEQLTRADKISEATKVAIDLLERGTLPMNRVFRFLLNKLASSGDTEMLEKIGQKIDQETKKLVSYDNKLCHANLVAGKVEDYLKKLEKDIDGASPENLQQISDQFPRGGAYGILERHPEFTEMYESLAIKYAKKGIVAPLNVLWTHYFINGQDEKAERIWDTYLKDTPRIMFQRIVQTARENKSIELIEKLLTHLKSTNVTPGAIGNAYSCLLDVLVASGNQEEIVKTFERAISEVKIDTINRTAVLRVKETYEKLGRPFDYPIPPKNTKIASKNPEES